MKIIGHRGARGEAPENTLGGFQHIIDLGLKAVEFDVRLLRDGKLAVLHDPTLQRTAGHADQLAELTTADLIRFDNRQGWPNWTSREPIPTLQQILDLITHFEHIEVEVKAVDSADAALLITDQLIVELNTWRNNKAITITSFDTRILAALQLTRQAGKHQLLTGLLLEPESPTILQSQSPAELALKLGCVRIGLADKLTTQDAVNAIKAAGLGLSIWTVNTVERALQLANWQVEGLITDYPTLMLEQHVGNI